MWSAAGWFFVFLGAVGAVLPIMPTVPFLLLAAYCFEKGSPHLHRWLMEHKTFGPPLTNWRQHRVIRPKAKAMSVICITLSVLYVVFFSPAPPWLKVVAAGSCASVMVYIVTRNGAPPGVS